jgi:uncharacterized protein YukE
MKFDMGAQTLSTLTRSTGSSHDELTTLVHQLVDAATPLEGKFQGSGRQKFDQFKSRVDEVTNDLSSALAAINQGQSEMDTSTQTGDQETADNASRAEGSANFDGARFSAR